MEMETVGLMTPLQMIHHLMKAKAATDLAVAGMITVATLARLIRFRSNINVS